MQLNLRWLQIQRSTHLFTLRLSLDATKCSTCLVYISARRLTTHMASIRSFRMSDSIRCQLQMYTSPVSLAKGKTFSMTSWNAGALDKGSSRGRDGTTTLNRMDPEDLWLLYLFWQYYHQLLYIVHIMYKLPPEEMKLVDWWYTSCVLCGPVWKGNPLLTVAMVT